ncbi:LuxR family transcriptional regulator [Microbacterium sp. EST19A]|uniref:helix-turn-helix transcriptional regulator n=1 Tax=Microbacterium sp. EST19A TaxID=2862681 RepID=UPI001CBD07B7|nr:LuxR family transcriptional regulator [Microbacterium sp. EST19A]
MDDRSSDREQADLALKLLETAVSNNDWEAAKTAVRTGWFLLAALHPIETRAALERVPPATLRGEPLLAMELGILLNRLRYQRIRALRYFVGVTRAARSPERRGISAVDLVLIRTAESAAYRLLGRYSESAKTGHAALRLAHELSDEDRASIGELPRVFTTIGVSLLYAGQSAEAIRAVNAALEDALLGPAAAQMSPLALLAGMHAMRGDIPQAQEYIDEIRRGPWSERQKNGYSGTFYRLAEALVALEAFDPETARRALSRSDALSDGRDTNEHWAIVARVQATIELVEGNAGAGLAMIDDHLQRRGHEAGKRYARAHLAPVRARLLLALGHPSGAAAVLKRDLPDGPNAHIERARIELALGNTGSALNELRVLSGEHLSNRQRVEAAAIDLSILLRLSRTPRQPGVVQRLGSLLLGSNQRLAVAILPPADYERVIAELKGNGFRGFLDESPIRSLLADVEPDVLLTQRELAVLEQLMLTGSVADLAARLVVSSNTVKTQLRSIYRKLGVRNREDAIALTHERHLLQGAIRLESSSGSAQQPIG